MPRSGRLHIDGGYYHVMGRGLERRKIFNQVEDKKDFLERLGAGLERTDAQCLAWSVMSNHYHLLIQVSEEPLSRLMASLLGGYANQYNRRHTRSGYVFANRYKSILCDADQYLLQLVRYIHLNPLKACVIKSIKELDWYRWTGHAGLLGKHLQPWQNTDSILALFGKRRSSASAKYRQFVVEGLHERRDSTLSGGGLIRSLGGWEAVAAARKEHAQRLGDERILGGGEFVEKVLREDKLRLTEKTALERQGMTLEHLIEVICKQYGLELNQLMHKGRANDLSVAKSLVCYFGVRRLGLTNTLIAQRLKISQPSVSVAVKRGWEYCQENRVEFDLLLY